jgi:hypothetical protein
MHDGGPISPELALVDAALAERARRLLPDPSDCLAPRPRRVETPGPPVAEQIEEPTLRAPSGRPWRRTIVLAGLVFAVGAFAGGLLGERRAPSPGVRLEAQAPSVVTAPLRPPTVAGKPSVVTAPLRSPTVARGPKSKSTRRQQRAARVTWAANVLGVAARVDRPGVTLVWQRPANSDHVVILRSPATRSHDVVVYRGRAKSFRDDPPLPCTGYRYTIVNYDRKGHRATGVPTSVVTQGCA